MDNDSAWGCNGSFTVASDSWGCSLLSLTSVTIESKGDGDDDDDDDWKFGWSRLKPSTTTVNAALLSIICDDDTA